MIFSCLYIYWEFREESQIHLPHGTADISARKIFEHNTENLLLSHFQQQILACLQYEEISATRNDDIAFTNRFISLILTIVFHYAPFIRAQPEPILYCSNQLRVQLCVLTPIARGTNYVTASLLPFRKKPSKVGFTRKGKTSSCQNVSIVLKGYSFCSSFAP